MTRLDHSKRTWAVLLGCLAVGFGAPSCGGDDDDGLFGGGSQGRGGAMNTEGGASSAGTAQAGTGDAEAGRSAAGGTTGVGGDGMEQGGGEGGAPVAAGAPSITSGGSQAGVTGSGGVHSGGTDGRPGTHASGGADPGSGTGAGGEGGEGGAVDAVGGDGGAGGAGATASAGSAGNGGEGGSAPSTSDFLFDFESDADGFTSSSNGVTLSLASEHVLHGEQALKVTTGSLNVSQNLSVSVADTPLWPGTTLTFNVWSPADADGLYVIAASAHGSDGFDISGNTQQTLVPGNWTTWTLTLPNTMPSGLRALVIQIGNQNGPTFAGGDFYVDAIRAEGGVADCGGSASATYGFQRDTEGWSVDGAVSDTTLASSSAEHVEGTSALAVAFDALPAPSSGDATVRRVYLGDPGIFCAQPVTFHVWLPNNPDLSFNVFSEFSDTDPNGGFDALAPSAIERGAWTELVYTIPEFGPLGIRRIGVEFSYSGSAPLTDTAYIDAVTW